MVTSSVRGAFLKVKFENFNYSGLCCDGDVGDGEAVVVVGIENAYTLKLFDVKVERESFCLEGEKAIVHGMSLGLRGQKASRNKLADAIWW